MIHSGVIPPFEMRPTGANDKLFDNATVDTVLAFYRNQYLSTYAGEAEPFQYCPWERDLSTPLPVALSMLWHLEQELADERAEYNVLAHSRSLRPVALRHGQSARHDGAEARLLGRVSDRLCRILPAQLSACPY